MASTSTNSEKNASNVAACNICGGCDFEPAYNGRMTNGVAPACTNCKSSERHRIIRKIYDPLRNQLGSLRALQFAPDMSIDPAWFADFTPSVFGGENSMNMENIALEDGSREIIISNHVLEHVANQEAAICEMLRVVGPDGLVHINIPSPARRWETDDWGYPKPELMMHYRDYGSDFPILVRRMAPDVKVLAATAHDHITGVSDVVYFLALNERPLEAFAKSWRDTTVAFVRTS